MTDLITATDDTLRDFYAEGKPLLILLHAGDVPKPLADAAAKLVKKHDGELIAVGVDLSANPTTAAKYNGLSTPAVVTMEQKNFGIREKSSGSEVRPSDLRAHVAFLFGKGEDPAEIEARKAARRSKKADKSASSGALTADQRTFKKQVLRARTPVLVDFWAPWCGPCRQVSPMVEALGRDYKGTLRVVKVNVDENQKLSRQYNISSIPALVLFDKGNEVDRLVGAHPRGNVEKMLKQALL